MDIITVINMPTMPGSFTYSVRRGLRTIFSDHRAGSDPASAAATAMNAALKSRGAYMIFGPQKVLECIPVGMRSKNE